MTRALLVALLVLAACGDDDTTSTPGDDAGPRPRRDAGPPDAGPPPDDSPSKGPWVLAVETTRATVRWESRLPGDPVRIEVEPAAGGMATPHDGSAVVSEVTQSYGEDSPLVEQPDYPGSYAINEVVVEGLAPGTCYRYRVAAYPEAAGRFCTAHEPGDGAAIRFLAIGDTNPALGHTEGVLANAPLDAIELVVHAGDIQYYSAIVETWQSWFGDMAPMLRAAAFYPSVGNHERELDAEFAQYYQRFFGGASADGDVIRYHYQTGGVHFFSLSSEDDLGAGTPQIDWLAAELDEAAASTGYRFSILYFHRPPYSVSDSASNFEIRAGIAPLVDAHAIPLVITGHAHGYERFVVPVAGGTRETTYIVTGGGGGLLGDVDANVATYPEDAALRQAAGDFFHAVAFTIGTTTIEGETTDEAGTLRDTFTIAAP